MAGTTGIYMGKYQASWKGKLELIFISDSGTYYNSIYFDLPTTPSYHHTSLVLLYYDPSCCPPTVPNYYKKDSTNEDSNNSRPGEEEGR